MTQSLRLVHAGVAWLVVAAIAIQVFLAGLALAQLGGSGDFRTHIDFGYGIALVALALVLAAVVARAGRRMIAISIGILVLYFVQTSLPYLKSSSPAIAALHPVNALVLFALATWYAREAWRHRRDSLT